MTTAERQREFRMRRRFGLQLIPTPISDNVIKAWIEVGILECTDKKAVAMIAAEVIEEYGLRFAREAICNSVTVLKNPWENENHE